MIFIYPPVAKLSEPPGGIARLIGMLRHHNIDCMAVDASYEGFQYLYHRDLTPGDTWTKRATKNRKQNLTSLRRDTTYKKLDTYKRCISDINRILQKQSEIFQTQVSLANYRDNHLSPHISQNLMTAAGSPERNVYYPYFEKRLAELYRKTGYRIYGFSINYLNQAICAFAMMGYLKKRYPDITIMAGGGLITSWMNDQGFNNPFSELIDHVIPGEGEKDLLGFFKKKITQKKYLPDYSDFTENRYLSPGLILPYSASGGCFWNKCRFCPEKSEENPYTPVKPVSGVLQLEELIRIYQPDMFHIVDNAVSPAFISEMIRRGFSHPWYGFVRISSHLENPDFVQKLKQTGCTMLKLGIESGDQHVLDQMDKGIRIPQVSRVLKELKKNGIATYVYLLFGTPAENEAAAEKTLEFTRNHHECISFLNISIFNLPSQSEDADQLITRTFYDGDLGLYREFDHPLGWDRKSVRKFLSDRFRKVPEIARILQNDPPVFTSNHAALF